MPRILTAVFLLAAAVSAAHAQPEKVRRVGVVSPLPGQPEPTTVRAFRDELQARRDLFYAGIRKYAGRVLSGVPPKGAFYAFLKIDPRWTPPRGSADSRSWAMAEYLISQGRIGCVPGADFGANAEGYIRFAIGKDRKELTGALEAMRGQVGRVGQVGRAG